MNRRGVALFGLIVTFAAVLISAYFYSANQREQNARDSQRQDYALCVIQNANRAATRKAALIQYGTIADVLKSGGPADPVLKERFKDRLDQIQALLKAQRPINCATYVRPDIPPDRGVH